MLQKPIPADILKCVIVREVLKHLERLFRISHEDCFLVKSLQNKSLDKVTAKSALLLRGNLDLEELRVDILKD